MKTALHYAQETLQEYADKSILNPMNKKLVFASETEKWERRFNEQRIITYLETILERLPYVLEEKK